jgi:hypothetical protein
MSRRRNYKKETLDIEQRFFGKIRELVEAKRIPGGIGGYCDRHGIDRRHFYVQMKDNGRGFFEVAWILPLVGQYGITAEWLLFGEKPGGQKP